MITVPLNNMRTLKFKTQPTNAFFATVNQMYGGGQLPTTAERAVIKSLERISRLYVLVWTKKQFENEAFRKQLCYDNHNISLPELTANCCAFNFSGAVWSGRKNIIPVFCCMVFMNILLGLKPTLR